MIGNAELNRSGGKYCSRGCWIKSRRCYHEDQRCVVCNSLIVLKKYKKRKYCSSECFHKRPRVITSDPIKIFWKNIVKSGGCWEYQKCISTGGYGRLCIKRKFISAHRFSYELHHGSIPEGMFVCHTCDNPPCVNPSHLWLGTNEDNQKDMIDKNRNKKGSEHWKSKLTKEQVLNIKKELIEGKTGYQLAKKYGVHHQTIYSIKSKQNWIWVKNE